MCCWVAGSFIYFTLFIDFFILLYVEETCVICRLGGPCSEKLWPRSWKCCPRPSAAMFTNMAFVLQICQPQKQVWLHCWIRYNDLKSFVKSPNVCMVNMSLWTGISDQWPYRLSHDLNSTKIFPLIARLIDILKKNHYIAFSLKRFLGFFDCFMPPLALSRFGTLAEFGTVAEYSFGSLADCWAC